MLVANIEIVAVVNEAGPVVRIVGKSHGGAQLFHYDMTPELADRHIGSLVAALNLIHGPH